MTPTQASVTPWLETTLTEGMSMRLNMTRHLMLAYALIIAALAGSTGVEWTIILPLPHLLAWLWLTPRPDLGTIEQRRVM